MKSEKKKKGKEKKKKGKERREEKNTVPLDVPFFFSEARHYDRRRDEEEKGEVRRGGWRLEVGWSTRGEVRARDKSG